MREGGRGDTTNKWEKMMMENQIVLGARVGSSVAGNLKLMTSAERPIPLHILHVATGTGEASFHRLATKSLVRASGSARSTTLEAAAQTRTTPPLTVT